MPLSDDFDDPSLPVQAARNPTGSQKWTLVVSCLSVALVIGSTAALYTSLPDIAAQTGAPQGRMTWVVGTSQAAMALSAITAVSAVILGIWAPGHPPATARRRPPAETAVGSQIDTSTESSTP